MQVKNKFTMTLPARSTNESFARACISAVSKAMEPLYTSVGGERAGLGFAVMESFMDSIKVKSVVGKGTTVTMLKKISPRLSVNG